MLLAMCEYLDMVYFKDTVACRTHGKECCWNPRFDAELADLSWLEIAGSTCVAWSGMGSGDAWLHSSTLPCLVWAYSLRYAQPDAIIHECVPNFLQCRLLEILNCLKRSGSRGVPPRCELGRSTRRSEYDVRSLVFSPTALGIPSKRRRHYTMFAEKSTLEFKSGIDFIDLFGRDLIVGPVVYACASESLVQAHIAQRVQLKHDVCASDVCSSAGGLEPELAFTSGEWIRLQEYKELATTRGHQRGDCWFVDCALVDLKQTSGFSAAIHSDAAPCLLRGSIVSDLVRDRALLLEELFVVQGIPHPAVVGSDACLAFPFEHWDIEEGESRDLLGNTMHLSAVGSSIMYLVACTEKNVRPCL